MAFERLKTAILSTCLLLFPAALAAQSPLAAVQRPAREAEDALRQGEWQLAESRYRDVLLEGYLLRGLLLAAGGDLDGAAGSLERATHAALPLRRPLMALAQIEIRRGRVDEILPILLQTATRFPGDGELRRLLAQALVAAGHAEQAVEELAEIVAANPGDLESTFALATGELSLGKNEAAEEHLARILAASQGPAAPAAHVLVGRTWRDYGDYPRARQQLEEALRLDPHARRAHFYLGSVELLAEGKAGIAAALAHFDRELENDPRDPSVHLYRGLALVEERRFDEAIPSLELASSLPSLAADALHFLGRCQAEKGRLEAAVASFEGALRLLDPASADPQQLTSLHVQLGNALRQQGKEDLAKSHFEAARLAASRYTESSRERLARYLGDQKEQAGPAFLAPLELGGFDALQAPERDALRREVEALLARALQNLGVLAARGGRAERALRSLLEATTLAPDFPGLDRALGIAAFKLGRRELAARHLSRALGANADDFEVSRLLALCKLEAGDPAGAAALLEKDGATADDPALLYALALARVRGGEVAAAEAIFARLEQSHRDWAPYSVLLAQAQAQQGNYAAAETLLARALELDPKVADAHATRGEILLRQGKLEAAATELRAELAIDPAHSRARFQLATALDLDRQSEAARRELAILLAREPENAAALYLLGKLLLAEGDAEGAAARLARAARLHPADVNVRYQWALALQRLGRPSAAAEQFEIYRQLKAKEREVSP